MAEADCYSVLSSMEMRLQFKSYYRVETYTDFISHMSESTFYSKSYLIAIC